MAVHIAAVVSLLCYFIVVVSVGVWSGRKVHVYKVDFQLLPAEEPRRKRAIQNRFLQRIVGANKDLSLGLSVASMTATWVGGGYLNGTAEAVYMHGIIYCQALIGYAISLILGGLFFAERMRMANAVTMLDPFQEHYGRWMGLLLCLPALCGELFWTAAMLAALGYTAAVIMGVDGNLFIVIAASTIFFYTALGGHYAVTYTDALQIFSIATCLWVCVPFAWRNKTEGKIGVPRNDWVGEFSLRDSGQIFDALLMTSLGGIPWQAYFQRVLGCKSDLAAKLTSYIAALGCVFMAIPPAIMGASAKNANLTALGYEGRWPLSEADSARVLPLSIQYLTPAGISILGMVGITGAVMSSADSSMLSASAMITKNIYSVIIRPDATETEVVLVLRLSVVVVGACATYLALSVQSVFSLWTLCSDVVYVLLFPQLVCVFFIKYTNAYGSFTAFVVGGISRWLCGEPSLNVPVSVRLPLYDERWGQLLPFRLACMVLGLATLVFASILSEMIFERGWLPPEYDLFHCFAAPAATATKRPDLESTYSSESKVDVWSEIKRRSNMEIKAIRKDSLRRGSEGLGMAESHANPDRTSRPRVSTDMGKADVEPPHQIVLDPSKYNASVDRARRRKSSTSDRKKSQQFSELELLKEPPKKEWTEKAEINESARGSRSAHGALSSRARRRGGGGGGGRGRDSIGGENWARL